MKRSSPYLFTINKVDVVRLLQDLYFKCTLLHTYIIMCIHGPRLKKNCRLLARRSCAPLIYWNGAFSLKLVHECSSEVLNSHKSRFCVLGVGSFSSRIAFCTKCASDESVVHQCLVLSVCACFAVLLVCLCLSCWLLCVCVCVGACVISLLTPNLSHIKIWSIWRGLKNVLPLHFRNSSFCNLCCKPSSHAQ